MPYYNFTVFEYTDMILIMGNVAVLALRKYRERYYGNTCVCPTHGRTIVQAVQRIQEIFNL